MEARRNKGMEEIWKALIGERILCVRMNETSKGVLLKNPLSRISRVHCTESGSCKEFQQGVGHNEQTLADEQSCMGVLCVRTYTDVQSYNE